MVFSQQKSWSSYLISYNRLNWCHNLLVDFLRLIITNISSSKTWLLLYFFVCGVHRIIICVKALKNFKVTFIHRYIITYLHQRNVTEDIFLNKRNKTLSSCKYAERTRVGYLKIKIVQLRELKAEIVRNLINNYK